jgi:DNA ligase (NAD+)
MDSNQVSNQFTIDNIISEPNIFLKNSTQQQLEKIIQQSNNTYYNNESIMSDEIYDILKDGLVQLYPKSKLVNSIGSTVTSNKVKLPTHLGSMSKIKPDTGELKKWLTKFTGKKVISDKLDGFSLLIDFSSDNPNAYTRGDGSYGQSISWLLEYIKIGNLEKGMVRGEVVISKDNWGILKKKYPKYSNPRNLVSGYVGRKQVSGDILQYFDFVAYEYITQKPLKSSEQLKILEENGFNVVYHVLTNTVTNSSLSQSLLDRRENSPYEVDGIIVTDDQSHLRPNEKNPKYAIAFKMVLDDQCAEVHVLGITWHPTMYGGLTPVVQVSEVILDGAKINNVTANNARFVIKNSIGGPFRAGSIVKITRSGGVIPKILKVVKGHPGNPIDCLPHKDKYQYHWDKNGVNIELDDPDSNPIVRRKRVEHFFNVLDVPNFKTGMVEKVIENGYDTIPKILNMTREKLLEMDGVKDKLAEKIYNGIKKKYGKASLVDLIAGTTLFGKGFGRRKAKPIIENIPNILDIDISNPVQKEKLYQEIVSLNGFSDISAQKFISGWGKFKQFYHTLPKIDFKKQSTKKKKIMIKKKSSTKSETKLDSIHGNRIYVFTGCRASDDLKENIIDCGGIIEDRIKKGVTHLVVKDGNYNQTSKVKAAISKGIQIITLDSIS